MDDGTSSNETRLGAVKDVQFAIDALSLDSDMLVIAGDNVLDYSLKRYDVGNLEGYKKICEEYQGISRK